MRRNTRRDCVQAKRMVLDTLEVIFAAFKDTAILRSDAWPDADGLADKFSRLRIARDSL